MNTKPPPERASNPLGDLLKAWRARRGRSQLELSLDMGISQRHISFIESGKSSPSRAMLLGMARALDIPLRDRNALLLSAGYAPMYAEPAWDAAEMRSIHRALERMLKHHDPFPAIVMDRHWNVLMRNQTAPRFFGKFFDLAARGGQRNLLHLMFDPTAMRPFVANWDQVAKSLFERVAREAVGGVIDAKMQALIAELKAYPDVTFDLEPARFSGNSPVMPIVLALDGRQLSYFSMVSTVGTPQAVAAQELRVECMFPADESTEAWHLQAFPSTP